MLRWAAFFLLLGGVAAGGSIPGGTIPGVGTLWAAEDGHSTLEVLIESAPQTLDPLRATDAYGVRIIHHLLFDTLLRLDPQTLDVAPGVARVWERVHPTRLRFTLREGIIFHDGRHLQAEDVVYTLRSLMDPQNGSPYGPRCGRRSPRYALWHLCRSRSNSARLLPASGKI